MSPVSARLGFSRASSLNAHNIESLDRQTRIIVELSLETK